MDYTAVSTTDWRSILQRNKRRSAFVIVTFCVIYIVIGLLFDLHYYANVYPDFSLSFLFLNLITFQLIPYASIITSFVAVISLCVTLIFHNKLMLLGAEYREVTPERCRGLEDKQLYHVVEEMKVAAGLRFMPRVFIIEADYMNAFASGYSERSAMVAITRGLMKKLDRDELQAVMAHELSHIRHMDIRLTLMASVLANLLLIMIDVLFYSVLFSGRGERRSEGGMSWLAIVIIVLRILLPIVTILLILFLSRSREYMADAGCVELVRHSAPLARALLKIQKDHEMNKSAYRTAYQSTPHEAVRREAYIFDPVKSGIDSKTAINDFFSTHPSLEKRLAALGFKQKR